MKENNANETPWKKEQGTCYCKCRVDNRCPDGCVYADKCPIHTIDLGCGFSRKGEFAEAEAFFKRVTESDPEIAEGWSNYGFVLLKLKDYAGARLALFRSLRLDQSRKEVTELLREANHEARKLGKRHDLDLYHYLVETALVAGDITKWFAREQYPLDCEIGKQIGEAVVEGYWAQHKGEKGPLDASEEVMQALLISVSQGFKHALAFKIAWPNLKREVAEFLKRQDPADFLTSFRTAIALFTGEVFDVKNGIVSEEGKKTGRLLMAYAKAALCELWEWQQSDVGKCFSSDGQLRRACQDMFCFGVILGEAMTPLWDYAPWPEGLKNHISQQKGRAPKETYSEISSRLYKMQKGNETSVMKLLLSPGERYWQRFMRQIAIMQEQPVKWRMPVFIWAGDHQGNPCYIMEQLNPIPERLPADEAVSVVRDVAETCQMLRAHKNEYFHCGIFWRHIARRADGQAVLVAYGRVYTKLQALIAPWTIECPHYLAPESLSPGWVTECAEVFELGSLLADLAKGDVPAELGLVIADATAGDSKKRIQSIPELIARLDGYRFLGSGDTSGGLARGPHGRKAVDKS